MPMYTATEELLTPNSANNQNGHRRLQLMPFALKPDYAVAYKNRGAIFIKFGQYQLAIEDFNNAIRLKPDYADAYNNRGTIYTKLGQYQLPSKTSIMPFAWTRMMPDTYFNRGIVYFTQGNNKPGCFDAQKACALGNCKILENAKGKGLCHWLKLSAARRGESLILKEQYNSVTEIISGTPLD